VATRVIQVPISEMLCPPTKSWKLRWRSARHECEAPLSMRHSSALAGSSALDALGELAARAARPHPCPRQLVLRSRSNVLPHSQFNCRLSHSIAASPVDACERCNRASHSR